MRLEAADPLEATTRLRARRAASAIRKDIEHQIETGALKEGDQLPTERALSLRFGASRAVVRSALSALAEAGRITREVGRGSFVRGGQVPLGALPWARDVSPSEMLEFRLAVEPALVDLVLLKASDAEIDAIVDCVGSGEKAATAEEFNFWDDAFHRHIAAATHNRLVIALYEGFSAARKTASWSRLKRQTMDRDKWTAFQHQHRRIAEALKAGDRDEAFAAARDHVLRARAKLFEFCGRRDAALSSLSTRPGVDDAAAGLASLWEATALPPAAFPALEGAETADVAIVGGGFTGLSTALNLAPAGGRIAVLEAHEPGWGASGRNGGQVIPGLKYDPPELLERYGPDLGERMAAFAGDAPAMTFDLIERHGIACEARRCGWIQGAHNAEMERVIDKRAASWAARGADVERLDKARTAALLGSGSYLSGWLDRRGGALNPLSFARGLAVAARAAGATIYARSPATALRREGGGYVVETPTGSLRAQQVVLATNAYTGELWPGLHRTIIPVHSAQIATEPLSDNVRRSILPEGHVSSDSRRVLLYFRLDGAGRLLMGGVGTVGEPGGRDAFRHLCKAVEHIFPQVRAPFAYHWYGRVAVTPDFMPHLHELAPGLHAGLGYNGRGVAMAVAMGSLLARRVKGEPAAALPFPTTAPRAIPFHGLRNLYVGAMRTYYRLRDIAS